MIRHNGNLTVAMDASAVGPGLPYGTLPRLLLVWMTTEAVRTKRRELAMGSRLADFMRTLEITPTGGRKGTITALHDQMSRLFTTAVAVLREDAGHSSTAMWPVASRSELWWDVKRPEEAVLWQSTVTLGEDFYNSIVERPVPVDMAALRQLRKSPLALDLYTWLTFRMSYLGKPTTVSWSEIEAQVGSAYARPDNFRAKLGPALQKVAAAYPQARVSMLPRGLHLNPSPTSVRPR